MTEDEYMASMQRDDPAVDAAGLIAAYEAGIDELRGAVAGMTREQTRARPVVGKWSTIEVVAHVADMEVFFADRIERTLAMDRPLLVSVDEAHYAGRLGYQSFDLEEELGLFSALRRHVARILRNQPPDAWQRQAVHTSAGLLTVRQLVINPTRHARHHLPFIAEKRAALGL